MNVDKLTVRSQQAIAAAQEAARRRGNPEVYPEHLLLALLDDELFAEWQRLRPEVDRALAAKPSVQGAENLQARASAAFQLVLDRAEEEAKKLEDEYVSMEALFLAL